MDSIICATCGKRYPIDAEMRRKAVSFQCKECGSKIHLSPSSSSPAPKPAAHHPESLKRHGPSSTAFSHAADNGDLRVKNPETKEIALSDRIQTRFSLILVLLTTTILLIFAVYNYLSTKSRLNAELEQFADITATRLSKYVAESLWSLDYPALDDSLRSEMMARQIDAILIRDRDGKTVYTGITRDKDWEIVPTKNEITGAFIQNRKTIARKSASNKMDEIGLVDVYVTDKFMNQETMRLLINTLITVFCVNCLIVILVSILLKKMIVRPIIGLKETANRISLGELDVPVRIQSKNEIGQLAEAFERMRISLSYALKRLQDRDPL